MLLRRDDSILVRHTRTDKSGNFTLQKPAPGKYLLVATYPGYADYVDDFQLKDSTGEQTLPTVPMVLKSKLLEQVVVNGSKGAIHMKGDTIEFKADSFKTQAGASVEDLLKKLPGIQVDRNGKITAQGETVQKVLVDGEEFFGDDPTLVTQNLRADMVDKVQLYDKKSEQAAFTGIDDGQKQKTLNLKLKDSKKNGFFGRVTGGLGTDGYYDASAMINMFKKKEKFSAYGILSNTGKIGLNWQERDNYGQSFAGMVDYDESNGYFSLNMTGDQELDSWSGRFEGQGLPTVRSGGVHYNNKWDDDRQSLNVNYKAMHLSVRDSSSTSTQYILPDSLYSASQVYFNHSQQQSNRTIMRHSADGSYEVKFDSTSTLKIQVDGGTDHRVTQTAYTSQSMARDSSLINDNNRTVSTVGDKQELNSNILWRKKLAKKGRTISLNIRENYNTNNSSGFLNSNTKFYDSGVFNRDSIIDQYKVYRTENTLLDGKLMYTEPLTSKSSLVFNYGATYSRNHSNRNSFNDAGGGKYTLFDTAYSNDYQFNVFEQKGGVAYTLQQKKIRLNFGSSVGSTHYDQHDLHADTSAKRSFINWYPSASFSYNFSQQRRFNFNYNGRTQQPTVTQIQPIRTNEDPLNIQLGNPALRQSFIHQFWMGYNDYKVLTERGIWVNMNFSFTENAFSSATNLDSTGKRTTQTVNVNGNYNLGGYFSYNFKFKPLKVNVDAWANPRKSRNANVVNGVNNVTNNDSYELGMGLYKSVDKKYEAGFRVSGTYTYSKSTINSGIVTQYWTWSINPWFDVFLPWKLQVHGDMDASLRQKTSAFSNSLNVYQLNAWIGRKFLKNDALQIRASGNDLLNQNIGFNRSAYSNFISQNTYLTIRRYFMFSVIWNFTKAGTPAPKN